DLQEEVARFLGYQKRDDGLPVEQFMRHYYLSAKAIRTAADALISHCEEVVQKRSAIPERRLPPFKVFRGKLTLEGEASILSEQPATLIRLFRVADEERVPLYSWARDQVFAALPGLEAAKDAPEVIEELKTF